MCLYVPKDAKIKTARRNRTVYKTVFRLPENKDIVESLYYNFYYKKNVKQPEITLKIEDHLYDYHYIDEGYHSYSTREQAEYEANRWLKGRGTITKVIKMEIPKGAKYVKAANLLVSSTIIWRE